MTRLSLYRALLCRVSFMLNVIYAECHLCWMSFMLDVTNKPCMLSVVMLNVVMQSVVLGGRDWHLKIHQQSTVINLLQPWKIYCKDPKCFWAENLLLFSFRLLIGVGLVFFQQFTGQPNIIYYAADIFRQVGLAPLVPTIFRPIGFKMKLTRTSPVRNWFIYRMRKVCMREMVAWC